MLADLLLLIPPAVSLYYWWQGKREEGSRILSAFLLTSGLAASLKLLFRIGRETGLDPFAFPSFHTALASSLFFALPNPWTLLYAVIMAALRVIEGYHGIIDVVGGFLTAGLGWIILRTLEKRLGNEIHRKSLHYGIAVTVGYFSLFLSYEDQILLTTLLMTGAVIVYLLRFTKLVGDIYRFYSRNDEDLGPLTLSGGLFLGSLVGATPMVGFILGYVDGLASIIGSLKHGVRRGLKTAEGLAGGFIGGFITFILLRGFVDPVALLSLVVLAPLVEYYSQFEDNLILSFLVVGVSVVLRASGLSL